MEYFSPWLRILQRDRFLMVCPCCTITLIMRYVNSLCKILLSSSYWCAPWQASSKRDKDRRWERNDWLCIFLGSNSLLDLFLFHFFLSVYSPRLLWYYTCGSHPSGFQEASKGIWCYNVCSALDCSFVCLINGLKYGKKGNKKCVTCFATLLQNELNSGVARFTTHIKPVLQQIRLIKCPHPRDISQAQKWQKDGGNAFSCRTKSL